MGDNLLIVHGGGPTAVINASLYGVMREALKHPELSHIYGARNGTGGLLKEDFIELKDVPEEKLELLLQTPGSAIGTSRDALEQEEYDRMTEILEKHQIRYVLLNGGNGTMDTCGKLSKACQAKGLDVCVMGIPKTMDNDLAITDHSPGFGSAARFIAQSVKEVCVDVKGLPIHVVVVEASGRNAGWITAASALAADEDGIGPDLIYLPERPFDEDKFIEDVKKLLKKKSGIVVVASEGLTDKDGKPIVKPIFKTERATYFGDVSSHLANLVVDRLGYKARGEKPGLIGRASISLQSSVDREEAVLAGETACKAVLAGETGKMVGFKRESTDPYRIIPILIDIDEVMMYEKTMPDEYINEEGNGVTESFKEWCRPLIGGGLPKMISLND
ncbi:MAG TPA: 6-phosphofructokinase [Candidatus Onthocola gallistercoris]|uniref:Pyrophosphate--fructose 6-phosphate 1-phosphotransferase n=1 Tax=Candidatus Onthocola gallistercoris TaxID=2840876 RepID=A0A9D1HEU2_9FIRM|nr:6-phosphofructokinase [Candidatus Onthocola gallistercoris]